jgi:2-polyprenyl-3-methyl-5-hydroxy-6-metoxy-1,4-benzoquinol methylase
VLKPFYSTKIQLSRAGLCYNQGAMSIYKNPENASEYLHFLSSPDGKILKEVLLNSFLKRLPKDFSANILDAGCGNGWLSHELTKMGYKVIGFDSSSPFIDGAKELYPEIEFTVCDGGESLPYQKESFDCVVLNMAANDLEDQKKVFQNLAEMLKPQGRIIATIVNPYYAFPAFVWKRGLAGFFFGKKPTLKTNEPYNELVKKGKKIYFWNNNLHSHFYPLSEILNNFVNAGLSLSYFEDISARDDAKFNLYYQLHRFPILLLLEFKKT